MLLPIIFAAITATALTNLVFVSATPKALSLYERYRLARVSFWLLFGLLWLALILTIRG